MADNLNNKQNWCSIWIHTY